MTGQRAARVIGRRARLAARRVLVPAQRPGCGEDGAASGSPW